MDDEDESIIGKIYMKYKRQSWLRTILFTALIIVTPLGYFIAEKSFNYAANYGYYSSASISFPRYSLDQMREFAFKNSIATDYKPSFYTRWNLSFNKILDDPDNGFNMSDNDVIVFLHIQKTAGTSFERFLVKHLNVSAPCICRMGKKRCTCIGPGPKKKIWLFSRYSTGWVCGLHADFTELFVSGCVDNALDKKEGFHRKRRYFYTSFFREPVARFISEYRHVERGATWLAARHICNGRPPTPEQLPMCFDPEIGWDGVTMDEFLACPYNLAFNRQTRMLADLTLINCYDTRSTDAATRDKIMLESAKVNLKNLAFFGLKEYMAESQWMFERLFHLKFSKNLAEWTKSKSNDTEITLQQMQLIRDRNRLDIMLYSYAKKLFFKRLKQLQSSTDDYSVFPHRMVNGSRAGDLKIVNRSEGQ
ncbi:Sulfotransferase family protein [Brugia pahangi]